MKNILIIILFFPLALQAQNEVFYHVFQRSFFDSDGDGHGDLAGIKAKLDYLQELGVNTILLTPLYASDFYHNYFAYDFEKIDPKYGTESDYITLVKEVHRRGMKIYQDVEMQYVAGTHAWFKESFGHAQPKYANYLMYDDAEHKKPWYFLNFPEFTTYDNSKQQIIVVNMNGKAVRDYTLKVLKYWVDPNKDGDFQDGVDGFRLDHMMDNLDNAGKLTNLFATFWTPLLKNLKIQNPDLRIVAEQGNWASFGHEYFTKGTVDYVFAFRLKFAISKFDKTGIELAADSTFLYNPDRKNQLVFLENHDTKRFASETGMTPEKEKAAAAIQLLIGGIPSVYYGQEIGMKGEQRNFGNTDGNDIGIREAFDWYKAESGTGTANWYKNTGKWWDERFNKPDDGISLEEERQDPNSLFLFYKNVLALRKKYDALQSGRYSKINNGNPNVLSFGRSLQGAKFVVFVNLSGKQQATLISFDMKKATLVFGENASLEDGRLAVNLAPFGVSVVKIE